MWNPEQIDKHIETVKLLDKIKNEVFLHISLNKNISEKIIQDIIIKKFEENSLMYDKNKPIVAFNENSSKPHYFPAENSKILVKDSLILIDTWAKFKNSKFPFADITWMAYYGDNIPEKIQKVFNVVIKARNSTLDFIREELIKNKVPIGKDIDKIAREIIKNEGFDGRFLHGTGHSIGFTSPHGNRSHLNTKGKKPLLINLGYAIEPGIYLENQFGIRSEINFYINDKNEVIITTPIQNEITLIN